MPVCRLSDPSRRFKQPEIVAYANRNCTGPTAGRLTRHAEGGRQGSVERRAAVLTADANASRIRPHFDVATRSLVTPEVAVKPPPNPRGFFVSGF